MAAARGRTSSRAKEVSEKSLELNVCAEILAQIRSWPGCARAVWLGLTQAQEAQWGLDEMIRVGQSGFCLMLQFKAPWPTSQFDNLYKFSVNGQQWDHLRTLAIGRPGAVQYVFPLYHSWMKVDRDAPMLLRDTLLVPVENIPVPPAVKERHRVTFFRRNGAWEGELDDPEPITGLIHAESFFSLAQQNFVDSWLPISTLASWVGGRTGTVAQQPSQGVARFRGLHAIIVPNG